MTVHTVVATRIGADALWSALKGTIRRGIRKAEKDEIQVARDSGLEHLDEFYGIYAERMRELGTPVFGVTTLHAMREHLGQDRLRFYLAKRRDALIGGMLCIVHNRRITDMYVVARRLPDTEYANYLLYWHAIRDAADEGFDEFDLGRSTRGSTVHFFKQKWGGADIDIPYRYYPAAGSPLKMGLLEEPGEKSLMQRLWSKLPLPVCNIVGPIIRRDLPFL